MKLLYYILHTFTGCPEHGLKYHKDSVAKCEKCGRVTFIFKTYW